MAIRFDSSGNLQSYAPEASILAPRLPWTPSNTGGGGGGGSSGSNGQSIDPVIEAARVARVAAATQATAQAAQEAELARKEAARKVAQEAAQKVAAAEAAARLQNIQGAIELKRINQLKQNIINEGGTTRVVTARDVDTGNTVELTTIKKGGKKVFEKKDTVTGTTSIVSYDVPKGGGSSRITGGVKVFGGQEETPQPAADFNTQNILRDNVGSSTQFLIDKGTPAWIAKSGGWVAHQGINIWEGIKTINTQISNRIPSFEEARSNETGIDSLNVKPIGYSRWTEERKANWDNALLNVTASNLATSETYLPTTIRAGSERLWTEIKEKPLLTAAVVGTSFSLMPITTTAGLISYGSGADIMVTDFGKAISSQAEITKVNEPIRGKIAEITGGTLQGIGVYVMPRSTGEVLMDATFVKYLPKIYKKIPLITATAFGTYGTYTVVDEIRNPSATTGERYGKFLVGGGALLGAIPGLVVSGRKFAARASDDFISIKKTDLGIPEVKINTVDKAVSMNREISFSEFAVMDDLKRPMGDLNIEFIPGRRDTYTGNLDTFKLLSSDINYKNKPEFPKVTDIQKEILSVVREEGGIVSGSFAQQTLVKDSRSFQDLDILVPDVQRFKAALIKDINSPFNYETKTITDSPLGKFDIVKIYDKSTRKHLADVDPIKFSEEGFGKMFEPIEVDGLKLLPPEVRLTSKVIQSTRPLATDKRAKVVIDIAQLSGNKDLLNSPSLLRGYGMSKAEQKVWLGGGDVIFAHGGQGVVPIFSDTITIKGTPGSEFFGTPTRLDSGTAGLRTSRMFGSGETSGISFLELFNPKNIKNLEFIPKRKGGIIEVGKLGKDFVQPNPGISEIEIARIIPESGSFDYKISKRFKTILNNEAVDIAIVHKVTEGTAAEKNILQSIIRNKVLDVTASSSRRTPQAGKMLVPIIRYGSLRTSPTTSPTTSPSIVSTRSFSATRGTAISYRSIIGYNRVSSGRRTPSRDVAISTIRLPDHFYYTDITPKRRPEKRPKRDPRNISRIDRIIRNARRNVRMDRVPTKPLTPIRLPKPYTAKKPTKGFGGFTVFGRRFGKFKPIGVGRTEKEAFSLGKKFASSTLGATFKVPKSKIFKLPGYKTKKTKEGTLFIEPKKRRLKKGSKEIPEIQFFKRLKGGKKR